MNFFVRVMMIITLIITLLFINTVNASTLYVSPFGNDAHNGSKYHPWRTLQHAANVAQPGDIIKVATGEYQPFSIRRSGKINNEIAFIADNAEIDVSIISRNKDGIKIINANYISIQGFTIKNAPRAGISAVNCANITLADNQLIHNKVWGIFTGFCSKLTISNNTTAYSQQQHGIYVSNTSENIVINNNVVHHNRLSGIQLNGDRHMGGKGIISHATIYNNTIYNNGVKGGAAINLDGVQYSHIYNNLLYNNMATGIAIYKGDGGEGSSFNQIIHNTVIMPDNGRWCVLFKKSNHNSFLNNVCVSYHKNKGGINIDNTSLEYFNSDYNALSSKFTLDDGRSINSLSNWKTVTGNDINSISVDNISELFDINLKDFTPIKNSPLKKNALSINEYKVDFKGNTRLSRPSIGAIDH